MISQKWVHIWVLLRQLIYGNHLLETIYLYHQTINLLKIHTRIRSCHIPTSTFPSAWWKLAIKQILCTITYLKWEPICLYNFSRNLCKVCVIALLGNDLSNKRTKHQQIPTNKRNYTQRTSISSICDNCLALTLSCTPPPFVRNT